jgi:cell pole-organizing protein PopZ
MMLFAGEERMTPKSDHDEDMSMDEILASIRRFVTDNPHDDSYKQEVPKRNRQESTAVRPIRQDIENRQQGGSRQSFHPHTLAQAQTQSQARPQQVRNPYSVKDYGAVAPSSHLLEPDVLELRNPLPSIPTGANPDMNPGMILEDSIAPVTKSAFAQADSVSSEGNTASYALTASANSMSRLAQTAKSAQHKQASSRILDTQNITIEQLIRDMVRPFIKEWVEANLHVLVEEMVAKEIKRITQHLE